MIINSKAQGTRAHVQGTSSNASIYICIVLLICSKTIDLSFVTHKNVMYYSIINALLDGILINIGVRSNIIRVDLTNGIFALGFAI